MDAHSLGIVDVDQQRAPWSARLEPLVIATVDLNELTESLPAVARLVGLRELLVLRLPDPSFDEPLPQRLAADADVVQFPRASRAPASGPKSWYRSRTIATARACCSGFSLWLLGWPRFLDASPAKPSRLKARQSRFICRTPTPRSSTALACLRRFSRTRLGRKGHLVLGSTHRGPIIDIMSTTWPFSPRQKFGTAKAGAVGESARPTKSHRPLR
jgi:hypothetical protein